MRIVTLFLSFFIAFSIYAQSLEKPNVPHILVEGLGMAQIEPDMAEVGMTVSATNPKLGAVMHDVNERARRVIKGIKELGIQKQDISSMQVHISPEYTWRSNERKFLGHRASQRIMIKLRDLSKYGPLISMLVKSGINELNQIVVSSSKENELEAQATTAAIENAKSKARAIVNQFGAQLGKVYRVSELITGEAPFRVYAERAAANYKSEQFEPGIIEIQKKLHVTFLIDYER